MDQKIVFFLFPLKVKKKLHTIINNYVLFAFVLKFILYVILNESGSIL